MLSEDGTTMQPNPHSHINPDHLRFFRFAGRVIGLALFYQTVVDVHFTRSFYKHILGLPVDLLDLESFDSVLYSSYKVCPLRCWVRTVTFNVGLQSMLENDMSTLGDFCFTVESDMFGAVSTVELIPGGANIPVTEENKVWLCFFGYFDAFLTPVWTRITMSSCCATTS